MDSVLDRSLGPGFDALEALLDKTEDKEQTERDVRIMIMTRQLLMAIDAERERRGLTKNDLAELAGINAQQVRRMFTSAKANPTLKTLLTILAAALGGASTCPSPRPRLKQARPMRNPRAPMWLPRTTRTRLPTSLDTLRATAERGKRRSAASEGY